MKGTFKITLAYLKELGACRDGQREFQKAFPDGGEYQEVLDRCAEEDRVDLCRWLLEHVGPTEDVRVYEEEIDDLDKNIIFAGRLDFSRGAKIRSLISGRGIKAGWGIEAGEGIKAGRGIKAGMGIEAGDGIKAGMGIEAGDGIKAGFDHCVFAGLDVPRSMWERYAVVTASTKPNNLMSGYWKPKEEGSPR